MNAWYTEPLRVLIADDDLDLQNLIGFTLRGAGFATVGVSSGADALAAIDRDSFSLLMLDINMPPPSGLEVCAAVRHRSTVPVLMLSARDREEDLLHALDAGADAYVTKPFSPRTLLARVRALVRRIGADEPLSVVAGPCRLDLAEFLLVHSSGSFVLTRLEMRLLRLLMSNPGSTLSPNDLIKEVWDTYSSANRNMLKQVIFRLRRKLATAPDTANALRTIAGGYAWSNESSSMTSEASDSVAGPL